MPFPSVLSSFPRPNPTDRLNSPSHSGLHNTVSSALGQIEAVIGVEGPNSVVGTLEYFIKSPDSDGGGHVQTANRGGTGQTVYAKGDLLVGQSSSVLSKLTVGTNGQFLSANSNAQSGVSWSSIAVISPSVATIIPESPLNTQGLSKRIATPSLATVGQVIIPFAITASTLTLRTGDAINSAGTIDITLYNNAGTASVFTVTTPTISNTSSLVSASISPVKPIDPGIYYLMVNTNTTTDLELIYWANFNAPGASSILSFGNLSGEPVLEGTYVIPAGAPPASIVTTAIRSVVGVGQPVVNTIITRIDG